MVDLKGKNILCNTKKETAAILEEAEKQGIKWRDGELATTYNPFTEEYIVLCFKNNNVSWTQSVLANVDYAKDLLNPDKEMTAHEFLNKFIEMACGDCGPCENCKTIIYKSEKFPWCNPAFWTKDNINQVYEIVKTGNKLEELPEEKAINNLKNHLDNNEKINAETLQLAIKVLEEKLNEKQK